MDTVRMSPVPIQGRRPKRNRRIRAIIYGLLIFMILVIPGLAGFVGWSLTHPAKRAITVLPDPNQTHYQTVEFNSLKDSTLLRGWLIPSGEKPDRIVIFAHGYTRNRTGETAVLPTVQSLSNQGIASLVFDFRNSGESEGSLTSVGHFEKDDLLAAIAFAKSKGYTKIGLIGYSMGAATSLVAAPASSDVKAVIADSPFADLRTYLEENLPVWSHLPTFPFTPLIMWEIPLLTGVDPDQVKPIETIKQLQDRPVMLIHTEEDEKIPSSNSKAIMEASGSSNTTLWLVPGTKHVGAYEAASSEYLQRVTDFMVQHLK